MRKDIPRILLAGDRSSSGKTTIVAGLLSALRGRGLSVQSYKVALDYIDPSYHTGITGRWCRNLDGHLMPEKTIREVYAHAAGGADVAVIEGVRGLYEGYDGDRGSTAQIAKMLRSPVILVVDARSITRSAAALVKGYIDFDPNVDIKGVILNKVGGERHARKAISAIREYAGVEVVGVIPRDESMHLSMRHLGLIPMQEGERRHTGFAERLAKIRQVVEEGLDIDRILDIAAEAQPLEEPEPDLYLPSSEGEGVRIGVALDEAFNFYYRDNIELIELAGAEVVPISPIHDSVLPKVDGLYVGGGYPELYAKELSENGSMIASIKRAHEDDIPIFAECGGLMYLCEEIDWDGESRPAVGLIPAKTRMGGRRIVSYTEGEFLRDCPMGPRGATFLGHEFHHSELVLEEGTKVEYAIRLQRGMGIEKGMDGIVEGNLVASYNHFHAASYREFPGHFIRCARGARDK
ncbi:Ni-sirohydrochlorin a,c-diamide synthase [Methanocrinis sp.]|uniref:Ni-sirohydrochlorin a,c-diamide synthase n=1 Tax=Methanocrinis sp. TaxID=3101522 RepID=UPI003D0F13A1